MVEVHVRNDQEINNSRDKGKAVFDLNESIWTNEETLPNTFEVNICLWLIVWLNISMIFLTFFLFFCRTMEKIWKIVSILGYGSKV